MPAHAPLGSCEVPHPVGTLRPRVSCPLGPVQPAGLGDWAWTSRGVPGTPEFLPTPTRTPLHPLCRIQGFFTPPTLRGNPGGGSSRPCPAGLRDWGRRPRAKRFKLTRRRHQSLFRVKDGAGESQRRDWLQHRLESTAWPAPQASLHLALPVGVTEPCPSHNPCVLPQLSSKAQHGLSSLEGGRSDAGGDFRGLLLAGGGPGS